MAAPKVSTLMQVVSGLPRDLKRLHLTFLAPDKVVATFAADNAHELYCWALVASAKMVSGRQPRLLLNKREFTALRAPATRLPIKKLSSCVIEKDGIWRLSAAQTSDAFTIDAQTGRPLPARTDVVFVDFT